MSKFTEANKKIEDAVVGTYKKVENAFVDGYEKIEDAAVKGYKSVEDKFVDTFLKKDNETLEEAKHRLEEESKNN